jgi:hypothetical protein
VTATQLAQLPHAPVSIEELAASDQGEEAGNQVLIAPDAAAWRWDFGASKRTSRMDLRWALDYEFGHVLGWSAATTVKI